MSTTNAKHTLEHPVTLAPLYRSEYRDDMTKARDAKGRRVSTEALVDGLAESRARIAELESELALVRHERDRTVASLQAVTAQRDQCREEKEVLLSLADSRRTKIDKLCEALHNADCSLSLAIAYGMGSEQEVDGEYGTALELFKADSAAARAALRACEQEGGAE